MGVFAELRQKYSFIKALVSFQKSVFYPILFAVLCTFSGLCGKEIYLPILLIIAAMIAFSALFTDDNKVFFPPMLMIYYALGNDTDSVYSAEKGELLSTFEMDGFISAIICGAVMAIAVFWRLIADGTVSRALKKRGLCFYGILMLDVAFLLNGAFSESWIPANLIYGAITSIAITLFYLLALSIADNSRDPVGYACQTLVCTSFVALAQSVVVMYQFYINDKFFHRHADGEIFMIARASLPWGIATIVGTVIVVGIPAALYLAMYRRYSFISYFSALILLVGIFLPDARAAICIGAVIFVFGSLLGCFFGRNKKAFRLYILFLAVVGIIALIIIKKHIHTFTPVFELAKKLLRFENMFQIGSRIDYWKDGIGDFISSPLFGVGFGDGAVESAQSLYSAMYHSLPIQLLASCGIFGMLAFLIHIKHVVEIFIRNFSMKKFVILLIPFTVIVASFVDNYFFYPNFQIIYAVFLALAEHSLEKSREKRLSEHSLVSGKRRPRVVFTFVEAGKGHVVPEEAICESFKEKYGNEFDVVESYFYSENGDKKLQKTEKLFAAAVKKQNKSRIISWLCKAGNLLCGDRFALYFLLSFTISGVQSKPRACKHLRELDADIIFTTHWSTAFYASCIKHPPYTVMLCPDVYSNGMFNVDVNDLLIPSEVGKNDAERIRMYAGGSVSKVDFPIRNEAKVLYGRKSEIRRALGISEDEFVVTMSDGGYGLANMESTVNELLKRDARLTVIALCGTNKELFERLSSLEQRGRTKIIPVPFTKEVLKYIVVADLFCGKSGANSMAEPAFFGIPIIVTRSITYIERNIKKYYVKELGGALSIPSPRLAAKKIVSLSENREELERLAKNLEPVKGMSGTDGIAELIYDRIITKVYK